MGDTNKNINDNTAIITIIVIVVITNKLLIGHNAI